MHRPPHPPPLLDPPPVVAPPPVETSPSETSATAAPPHPPSRLIDRRRDARIGGICLVVGMLLGHGSWDFHDRAVMSPTLAQTHSFSGSSSDTTRDTFSPHQADLATGEFDAGPISVIAGPETPEDGDRVEATGHAPVVTPVRVTVQPDIDSFEAEMAREASEWGPVSEAARQDVDADPWPKSDPSIKSLGAQSQTVIPPVQCVEGSCQPMMESHGTALMWADKPADAYRMAGKQDKPVFLIHVSGNFEIPGFT